MANYSKTIQNSILFYGGEPTNRWDVFRWDLNKWDTGDLTVILSIAKTISNVMTLSDSIGKNPIISISESMSLATDMEDSFLQDRNGWFRVFPGPTIDSDNRVISVWSEV